MKSTRRPQKCRVPLALRWSHSGVPYRVTAWPEVQFERQCDDEWIPTIPSLEAMASAAQTFGQAEWQPYLEFVPAAEREFLSLFSFTRMEALQVIAPCPTLLSTLTATPALTPFVFARVSEGFTERPGWAEIETVHERNGVFGLLEMLGLPASRQTLAILRHLVSPDVPKRLLEPLRSALWEPRTLFALQRETAITDRLLEKYCHALAA